VKGEFNITCSLQIPRGEQFITCVNNNSLYKCVTSDCASTIQKDTIHLRRANSCIFLSNNTLKHIESVTGTQAVHIIVSFEFKSDYITSNYKVLTIINITVHVCVAITVKSQKPNSCSSCLSEQIVHPIVSRDTLRLHHKDDPVIAIHPFHLQSV